MNGARALFSRIFSLFSIYRGLPAGIWALFFTRMVNAMGNFVAPFLTLLLTERYGYSAVDAGTFVFIASLSVIPGALAGGKISDVFGRRRVLIGSHLLSALCFIPCGFLGSSPAVPWFILAGNFLLGAARPAAQAITTDLSTAETRKAAFSLTYLGNNLGFALGPLIAGFLYSRASSWIYWGDAISTFAAMLLVVVFIPESLPSRELIEASRHLDSPERAESGNTFSALASRPFLLTFIGLTVVTGFVYAQHLFSLPIQLNRVFGGEGPMLFGVVMSVNAVVVILCTTPLIALTSQISPVVNQGLASVMYAVGFGMLYSVQSFPMYIVSTVVWTIGEVLAATNVHVYVANNTPISHRGRFNAIIPIITGIGASACPLLMGRFITSFSLPGVWLLSFALALAAACGLFLHSRLEATARKKATADFS